MTKKFFADNLTTDELKKAYRKLCKELHPDNGGDADAFKRMNAEYAERTKGSAREQARKSRARRDAEEAARKAAEEAARKAAEKATKKPRKGVKQKVWEDLLHRFEGKELEKFTWYGYNCFRWNNAVFVATGKGVDIYFEDEATCAKAIEAAKKHWFWDHSDYRKCVCWVKALKNEALDEVLKALAA